MAYYWGSTLHEEKMPMVLLLNMNRCFALLSLYFAISLTYLTLSSQRDSLAFGAAALNDAYATSKENVNTLPLCVISDRLEGIFVTVGSVLEHSSAAIDLFVIGSFHTSEKVKGHFSGKLNSFSYATPLDIELELMQKKIIPVWKWSEWGSFKGQKNASREYGLHPAGWDNLATHHHILNHIRFYLPYLDRFKKYEALFFLDDDLIVKTDISKINYSGALMTAQPLVAQCGHWRWNKTFMGFEHTSKHIFIQDDTQLYGQRPTCGSYLSYKSERQRKRAHILEQKNGCVYPKYRKFISHYTQPPGNKQYTWNFGFTLIRLRQWRYQGFTHRYEKVMRGSYHKRVFPETSLTFGLGIAFLAFAGSVQCFSDLSPPLNLVDGFSYIKWNEMERAFGTKFLEDIDVVHYTGPDKPWHYIEGSNTTNRIDPKFLNLWSSFSLVLGENRSKE